MRSLFIVVWLVLQVGAPLRYYLGHDRFDERFAWRMFSPVRLVGCQTRFVDATGGEQTLVRPGAEVHEVWTGLLSRGRRSIIEGYARYWCSRRQVVGGPKPVLTVDVTCANPDTLNRVICQGAASDADGDGIPDNYRGASACGAREPRACFRDECGELSASDCREAMCRVRPVPDDVNLCEAP